LELAPDRAAPAAAVLAALGSGRVARGAGVSTGGTAAPAVAMVSAVSATAAATARPRRSRRWVHAVDAMLASSPLRVGSPAVRSTGPCGSVEGTDTSAAATTWVACPDPEREVEGATARGPVLPEHPG
jgi:hypothetical protein